MAFALLIAQTLVLVAGLALLAQFVIGLFSWGRRQGNFFYQLFELIARPAVKLIRLITPKIVLDRHIPIGAFMILVFAYFWLGFEHRASCKAQLDQRGCEKWAAAWTSPPAQ